MFSKKNVLELLLVLLIFTFFLGDSLIGPFVFAQNFRFAMVLVCSLYLLKYNLFKNNNANYIIPFTIVAFCITILFSPVGISAVLRSLGFWLVGLLIFKIRPSILSGLQKLGNRPKLKPILFKTFKMI